LCPTLIADDGRQGALRPVKRYLGEAQALTGMQVVQPRRASPFMAGKPLLGFSVQGLLLTMRHTQRIQLPRLRVTWARSGCVGTGECLRPEWGYGTWSSLTRSTRRWRNPLHKPNTTATTNHCQLFLSSTSTKPGCGTTHTHTYTRALEDAAVCQGTGGSTVAARAHSDQT
jgi:hypothetical protein